MIIKREWATPLMAGAFLLSAVTGVLIFFHLDSGLNKVAHEWFSWLLLGGAALHITVNFAGIKRHLSTRKGQLLVGIFALILLFSFAPVGDSSEPPFMAPLRTLAQTPLPTVALVAQTSPEQWQARLASAGLSPQSAQQSVSDLVGPDFRKQAQVLNTLLAQPQ